MKDRDRGALMESIISRLIGVSRYEKQLVMRSGIMRLAMRQFFHDHVFILPHAQEYRRLYGVSVEQVLSCLNEPDLREGLAEDHYTVEKMFDGYRLYVYYYLTLPLQRNKDE